MALNQVTARLNKSRYRVDLSAHMACCESNYARLIRLMPDGGEPAGINEPAQWNYQLQQGDSEVRLELVLLEETTYTSMIEVRRSEKLHDWDSSPRLHVRLYHDAKMAEVVFWWDNDVRHKAARPRYEYPNERSYHRDERVQFNRFLHDWLVHSQAHGRSTVELESLSVMR